MRGRQIVASAGTYHLPFNRFSEWMERWLRSHDGVSLVMQHGPSTPVQGARNVAILPYGDLLDLCRDADVVVLQGGAGAVMDMRSIGVVPIVVPRVPGGGEAVDDHQLVFCAEMERLGLVSNATTFEDLSRRLDERLAGVVDVTRADISTPGAQAVRELMDDLPRPLGACTTAHRLVRSVATLAAAQIKRARR